MLSSGQFLESIENEKVRQAFSSIAKIPAGNFTDKDAEQIESLELSADEYRQLTDIANLLVRAHLFKTEDSYHIIYGALEHLKNQGMVLNDIIHIIENKQSHQEVFTAHPTYNGGPEYTDKILKFFANPSIKLATDIIAAPAVRAEDMTVLEESDFVIKHIENALESEKIVHQNFKDALKKLFPEFDGSDIDLNLKFLAWGIGGADKDGNRNVTEADLAEALKRNVHKTSLEFRDTAENNIHILKNIIPEDVIFDHIPREYVAHNKVHNYEQLCDLRNINLENFRREIYSLLARLQADGKGNYSEFLSFEDVERFVYQKQNEYDEAVKNLSLRDKRIFDELQRYITEIVRNKLISALLDKDRYPVEVVQGWCSDAFAKLETEMAADKDLAAEVKAKGYKNADYSYFYHAVMREKHVFGTDLTISRVCAEATLPIEYKEQLLFQRSMNIEEKKIILLFEDPEVLKKRNLARIIRSLVDDKVIFSHIIESSIAAFKFMRGYELSKKVQAALRALSPELDTPSYHARIDELIAMIAKESAGALNLKDVLNLEIMLAHSDNTRRGGMLGARALIYSAHDIARYSLKETGISPLFYEGGSITDSMRNGMRPVSDMFDLYKTHRYRKYTVQGIDMAVAYIHPQTGAEHLAEAFASSVKVIAVKEKYIQNFKTEIEEKEYKMARLIERDLEMVKMIGAAVDYYISEYFLNDSLGYTIAQVFEMEDDIHANKASRKARVAVKQNPFFKHPIYDRTIMYSERGQQKGDNYGYVGAGILPEIMRTLISRIRNIDKFKNNYFKDPEKAESKRKRIKKHFGQMEDNEILQEIFRISPHALEIKERMAYSLAATDLEMIWNKALEIKDIRDRKGEVLEVIHQRPEPETLEALAKKKDGRTPSVMGMLAWKELEYRKLAALIYTAYTAKTLDMENLSTAEVRKKITELLDKKFRNNVVLNESANILIKLLNKAANEEKNAASAARLKDAIHFFKDICLFQI